MLSDSPMPIVGIRWEDPQRMQDLQRYLEGKGILMAYMQDYPAAGSQGILRIAVFATHTETMVDRLLQELAAGLRSV